MKNIQDQFLWVEKYRPKKLDDCVLTADLRKTFKQFVADGKVPNLLLCGTAGVGKTTVAKAMLEELDCDYIVINGSLNGNIDTLRNEISQFASSVSLQGGRKYVILDEADYLNPNSTQPALRGFIEEFSNNCGFIFTCNFKNRIIEPLHSRTSVIDFKIDKAEKPKMATAFYRRVMDILTHEGIESEPKAVAALVEKHFPDWRRVLNELQRYSATGKIDSGVLVNLAETTFKTLIGYMREKDFTSVRKWVAEHSDIEPSILFRNFYDTASQYFKPSAIAQLVLIIAEYQYKSAFVADQEINLVSCLIEIMSECEFS